MVGHSVRHTLQLVKQRTGLADATAFLPTRLGGQYQYQQLFEAWVRTRLAAEEMHTTARALTRRYKPSAVPQVTHITAVAARGTLKRRLEAAMVKNGSAANERKQTKGHLIESCEESKKKLKSKESNNESSSNSVDTNSLVNGDTNDDPSTHSSPRRDPKEAARRARNALYSRRSFYKRQLEKLALENQTILLRAENERLRQDHDRLQAALQQARTVVLNITMWSGNDSTTAGFRHY